MCSLFFVTLAVVGKMLGTIVGEKREEKKKD
jgi:hypothetical protein